MEANRLRQRIYSVDLLRGIVMMIMMIDHVREFTHSDALLSDPTDPATTTIAVFFSRWITHFCAPTFVFLSGVSIYLQKLSGKSNSDLSRFLVTRGLWLIFLEFTVVRFSLTFNFDYSFVGLAQVIWVIGVSMVVMSALIYLPVKVIGIVGVLMILLHNLLDVFQIPPNISFGGMPPPDLSQSLWLILHQPGIVPLFSGSSVFAAYPLIPWIGVMMAGYALGQVYLLETDRRRKMLLAIGTGAIALFFILRGINVYGDLVPWSFQASSIQTVFSFLNTTKYPPSLIFLLMTLGPSIFILALTDGIDGRSIWQRVPIVFGRVPMFYYVLHLFYAHGAAVFLTLLSGRDASYLFSNLLDMGQNAPPGHGFSLGLTYLVWFVGLIILYPLCLWWGNLKQRNKHWALSYL